jgi:predicted secreted protein
MAAAAGRNMRVQYKATASAAYADMAGARTDGFTISNEHIDITDKDDSGIVTYLDDIGRKSFEMTVEGVLTTGTFLGLAANAGVSAATHLFAFDVQSLGTIAGSFVINSFEGSGADGAEAATFSMTVASSGAVTWTTT